jgi:hypothetical protein
MSIPFFRTFGASLLVMAAVAGCSSGMDAAVRTAEYAVRGEGRSAAQLDPRFRYIRVTTQGRSAFLALGNEDSDPLGPIEVYYSAQREVLRLQNGRLAGATGMTTEWRNVTLPKLPSWSQLAVAQTPMYWVRLRDVMPGYRYGVQDSLSLQRISPPSKSELQNVDPKTLTWFEERVAPNGDRSSLAKVLRGDDKDLLPPARYGLDLRDGKEVVVYGEQCLAADLCFTWQRWPVGARMNKRVPQQN